MNKLKGLLVILVGLAADRLAAQDFLDQVDQALTLSGFNDQVRGRLSGLIDLEQYGYPQPPPATIYASHNGFFNPRFSFFLDGQVGSHVYLFAQARVDRGFDPRTGPAEVRADEYALRVTPWGDGRLSLQVGKFATVVGNWVPRHLSWENPFITPPGPYENLTTLRDSVAPSSPSALFRFNELHKYSYLPVLWGPDYAAGASAAGTLGRFDYAAEIKNSSLSARPEAWDPIYVDFSNPTVSGRLGYRPNVMWNFGCSGSEGPYFLDDALPTLPAGARLGDYRELVLGQDLCFAWHHWQLWAECFETRFQVPRVGNADLVSYYLEAKYTFAPRFFGALRWNEAFFGEVPDGAGGQHAWGRDLWRTDAGFGFRLTEHTQLKLQYSLQHRQGGTRLLDHLLAVQFTVRY